MPYELHITRRKFWADSGDDISEEEWLAAIEADPELERAPEKGPHAAQWIAPSARPESILDWAFGNVVAADPDRPLIDKLVALADKLEARVQGVNGEPYDLCEAPLPEGQPTLRETLSSLFRRRRP